MADSTESASPIVQLISPEDQQQIASSKVDDAVPSVDAVADVPATSFVLEEVPVDDITDALNADDGMVYEEVPAEFGDDADAAAASGAAGADAVVEPADDFASVINQVKREKESELKGTSSRLGSTGGAAANKKAPVIDDFVRSFLQTNGLTKTLESFQTEWYELQQQSKLSDADSKQTAPDVYVRNQDLEAEVRALRAELSRVAAATEKAQGSWERFKAERDTHRMHHRRVAQEKNKLITDLKRLQKHYSQYEPTIRQLRKKFDEVSKEKVLIIIQKDRLQAKVDALEQQIKGLTASAGSAAASERKKTAKDESKSMSTVGKDSVLPPDVRENPFSKLVLEPQQVQQYHLAKSFTAHNMAVTSLSLHPTKPIVVTTSDDRTWKMWTVPKGDLIMTGDGHKDWVSSSDFHPEGALLATGSGDNTVKLWDLKRAACIGTFTDHTQAVWDVAFHQSGDFIASASMDHTARLWDINSMRCRQTLRGHVDSVNALVFQPYTNTLVTGCGDKTVSLWDLRSGLCVQTFYGHHNSVTSVDCSLKGDSIVSTDSDGVAKIWDVRMVAESAHIVTASLRIPLNDARFDRSGKRVTLATDSGAIKVYSLEEGKLLNDLEGHEDAVQALLLDPAGQFMLSGGSDHTVKLWAQ